jgi:5'-nucleotidase
MTILITNDDGIHSKGILELAKDLSKLFDVLVMAPDREQSAVGHAITLSNPLRITKVENSIEIPLFSCNGTPADAVKLAIKVLMDEPPELLISGINHGANVGASLIYSGTVSAATEGTLLGIPSISVSIDNRLGGDYSTAIKFTELIAKKVLANGLPEGVLLNINIPDIPPDEIKGVKVASQGNTNFNDFFEKRKDPRGQEYYWMTGAMVADDSHADHDVTALSNGYITITPVHYDLTARKFLPILNNWGLDNLWKADVS